ncbi:DUF2304 domain-containing protein [Candidatus Woesearchaeota archaeon]|nr:DUF2304 domain-containing protein [Candidatus Woesearchaeota archaeon]
MAKILGIQILGILFVFFMMYYTFLQYKRKEFTIKEYSFWFAFWSIFAIVTLFPQILDPILTTLSLVRALDFFIIAGFLFLIFVIFYTYTVVRKTQKKVEEVVRNIAINQNFRQSKIGENFGNDGQRPKKNNARL